MTDFSNKPLLQIALDTLDVNNALSILEKTKDYVDIIEIGTPLIKCEGLAMLKLLKEKYGDIPILVDLKTMDAGEYEVTPFFKNGAKYVTVLGAADKSTIAGAIKAAKAYDAKVVVDLIAVTDKVKRIKELSDLDVNYFNIHTGIDQQLQGQTPMAELLAVSKECPGVKLFATGGISSKTIKDIASINPAVIVVGGGITSASDPGAAAKLLRELMV